MTDTSYIHVSSDGSTRTRVYETPEGERYYRVYGPSGVAPLPGRMMLPAAPSSVHGRYWAEQLATNPSPRRAYRELHDALKLEATQPPYASHQHVGGVRKMARLWNISIESAIAIRNTGKNVVLEAYAPAFAAVKDLF